MQDSAYWIDGMTRLGAVLHDSTLTARVREDIEAVIANPDWFNATWTKGKSDGGNEAEGWVRSIYSRAMLAFYDYSGDPTVLAFLTKAFLAYEASMSQGQRSLTQIEALLETHAYGGPSALVETAKQIMATNSAAAQYKSALLGDCSQNSTSHGGCLNSQHGVTFNELAKLFAMISSVTGAADDRQASVNAYEMVAQFDVQVHGAVSANEALSGIGPNVGTEVSVQWFFLHWTY